MIWLTNSDSCRFRAFGNPIPKRKRRPTAFAFRPIIDNSLNTSSQNGKRENVTFWRRCVCVNTCFRRASVTVAGRDGHLQEFDRPTGAEVASEERLVAGSFGHKTSVARLEHKPGFTGQSGIAAAQGARL